MTHHAPPFRRWHLFWLLALPVWQFVDFVRHEGAHALAALALGYPVEYFYIDSPQISFPWFSGYVWNGTPVSWIVGAAPFLTDLVVFVLAVTVLLRTKIGQKPVVAINVFALGVAAPLALTTWRWVVTTSSPPPLGDIGKLYRDLSRLGVDVYFAIVIVLYAAGALAVLRFWFSKGSTTDPLPPSNSAQEPTADLASLDRAAAQLPSRSTDR